MDRKNKKIILLVSIALVFFGIGFLNFYSAEKSPLPDPISAGKTYGTARLDINGVKYESEITEKTSVYDFMSKLRSEGKINFTEKNYIGMGKFIETINGVRGDGKENWIYYVNGLEAQVGVSNYKISKGDVVSWKYESR